MREYRTQSRECRQLRIFSLILSLCSVLFALCSIVEAGSLIHKKFIYYVYWSGIRAGKAVLDYKNTPEEITIKTHATSASFISLFYKVDDIAESTINPDGYPKKFKVKIHEGSYRRLKVTDFGLKLPGKPQKVIFNNILDDETIEFELEKRVYDPLSAFYEMTKRDIKVGQSEYIDIFDNKKLWNTKIQVLRKEKIRVIAGEFDTIVVKPLIKSEGIFLKKGEIHIWVTDDKRKIPVKFTSKGRIGKFTVMLVEGDY